MQFNKNNEATIEVPISISNQSCKLIIDTAAEISIMKSDKIRSAIINKYNRTSIIGLSKEKIIRTLGTVRTQINFNGVILEHEDAVLGNDFLKKAHSLINYLTNTFTVHVIENPIKKHTGPLQKRPKMINLFTSKITTTSNTNNYDEYNTALREFHAYNNKTNNIHVILKHKTNNAHFYDELSANFFDKMENLTPKKIEVSHQPETIKLRNNQLPFTVLNLTTECNQITNRYERMKYLIKKFDLDHLNDKSREKI